MSSEWKVTKTLILSATNDTEAEKKKLTFLDVERKQRPRLELKKEYTSNREGMLATVLLLSDTKETEIGKQGLRLLW